MKTHRPRSRSKELGSNTSAASVKLPRRRGRAESVMDVMENKRRGRLKQSTSMRSRFLAGDDPLSANPPATPVAVADDLQQSSDQSSPMRTIKEDGDALGGALAKLSGNFRTK